MEETILNQERTIQALKEKCNKLLDIIDEMRLEKEECQSGKKESRDTRIAASQEPETQTALFQFLSSLCSVIRQIQKDEAFIRYSNQSKNSILYHKIEKETFERYIEEFSALDKKDFIAACVDLQYLKSEKNRKCVYNSDALRVYFVSKAIVKLILTEPAAEACG